MSGADAAVMEHRWGTRVTLHAAAELRMPDGRRIATVIGNASLSGAYLLTRQRLPVLSCVAIRAREGDGSWLEACIVRHDDQGMGVEWLDPGLRPVCALLALRRQHEEGLAAAPQIRTIPGTQKVVSLRPLP